MAFPGFGKPPALYFLWILPKNLFSRICGFVANLKLPKFILQRLIRLFCHFYPIDLNEVEQSVEDFDCFNAFFTRKLRQGVRPLAEDPNALLCPVDGALGEYGIIRDGNLLQAKGLEYRLEDLLQDPERKDLYDGGHYITLYLAPHNYHRIHSPAEGQVKEFAYVPGDLWTVSELGVMHVPGLFAMNVRILTYLQTKAGECAIIKVGATVVGKIRVCYHDKVSNLPGATFSLSRLETPWHVERGGEIGVFELGSTVICLFQPGQVEFDSLNLGQTVYLGQSLGKILDNTTSLN